VTPLTYQHRGAVVEVRHHECRIWIGQDRVFRLDSIRKPDDILAQLEGTGPTSQGRSIDLEWPSAFGMKEPAYWRTTAATAAAAAAT
jgi:hypothetical protein